MHKSKNRFISFMLSCLTVFSLASPVMAENETIYPTFDESRTGSITLYKYVSNDGKTVLTDGTSFSKSEEDNFNQIQAATGSYQMLPEKGVEFAYLKVGDSIFIRGIKIIWMNKFVRICNSSNYISINNLPN